MSMREKIAQEISLWAMNGADFPSELADTILNAMRDPPMDVLQAGYEAMFEDKWDGTQAPMMGAGYDAMIDAALAPGEQT